MEMLDDATLVKGLRNILLVQAVSQHVRRAMFDLRSIQPSDYLGTVLLRRWFLDKR